MRAVSTEKLPDTAFFDKSNKLCPDDLDPKCFDFFEGDTLRSHVIADVSTFFINDESFQNAMYCTSIEKEFDADHFSH